MGACEPGYIRPRIRGTMRRSAYRNAVVLALFLAFTFAGTARAELVVSLYGGKAVAHDADVKLDQPGGTHLTFNDVSWDDESFQSPLYYGARLGYWWESAPHWGVALDYTHAKMIAPLGQTVTVSGTRNGVPVQPREPLSATFDNLNISHGHNLLTLNLLYRWQHLGEGIVDRLQPYLGIGAGVAIPHVEVATAGGNTEEYQVAGPAYQALCGVDFRVYGPVSLFLEYKVSYADLDMDLSGGGRLEVEPWTSHFIFGVSCHF